MAGLLEDMSPQQYGLLMTGLGMMSNSRGRSVGEAFGAGGMQGLQAMAGQQQQQQMNALRAAQEKRYQALAEQEQRQAEQQAARQQVMQGVDPKNPDSLMKGLMAIGDYETALKINKRPNGIEEALWAAGGDENQARQLLQNKMQNPLGMLNYQLQAGNMQADNARANEALDLQRKNQAMQQEKYKIDSEKDQQAKFKDIPGKQYDSFIGNNEGMRKIDEAIAAIDENPDAFGMKNYLPDAIIQRYDEAGVDPRAKVSEIQGVKLHDLSGAAVSPAESTRLMRFLPTATDTPEAAKVKLRQLRKEFESNNSQLKKIFTGTNGFKEFPDISAKESQSIPESGGGVVVDIKDPGALTPENKAALNADVEKEKARMERRKKYLNQ